MKSFRASLATLATAGLLFSSAAPAVFAAPKDYQWTGQVTAVTDTTITVMKGKESSEFAKAADTKISGEVKTGDKVTVHYTMTAASVDVAPAKAEKAAPAKGKKADKAAAKADMAAPMASPSKPAAEASPAAQ